MAERLAVAGLSVDLGRREVLREASLAAQAGEVLGLIGPNGAGKSTLLRAVLGLVPSRGEVRLDGADARGLAPRERARRVGWLPQTPECHWPLAVEELVGLGLLPFPLDPPAAAERVARVLAETDLAAFAGRRVSTLSGGERARVFLARAIVGEPPLLLADEPVAGLDPAHQLDVVAMLQRRAGGGAAVVLVLHDLTHAARFCDRVALLAEGRIVATGAPAAVLTAERLARCYGVRVATGPLADRFFVVPVERIPAGP